MQMKTVAAWTLDVLDQASDKKHMIAIVPALTVAILLFHGFHHFYFKDLFQVAFIFVLLIPGLLKKEYFWFGISCLALSAVYLEFSSADNHKFLLFYWCLALFFAFQFERAEEQRDFMVVSARYLMFFTMLGAVIQKTISPDYLDGSFFEITLLTDSRFRDFVVLMTDMDYGTLMENRALKNEVRNHYLLEPLASAQLIRTTYFQLFAHAITWLNYLDQVVIGALALFRLPLPLEILKHLALMVFIIIVYAVAPVIGFGWLIIIWGYCMVPDELKYLRVGYIGCFVLLALYEFPFGAVLSAVTT